jgi:hypothetical protein
LGLGSGEELGGGEVAEGLVGAGGIVGRFPGAEFGVQGGKGEVGGGDLVELLAVGSKEEIMLRERRAVVEPVRDGDGLPNPQLPGRSHG